MKSKIKSDIVNLGDKTRPIKPKKAIKINWLAQVLKDARETKAKWPDWAK